MRVTITRSTPGNKDAAIRAVRSGVTRWVSGDVDFDGVVSLYKAGHVLTISDTGHSGALIIDLDHLDASQARRMDDAEYLERVAERLGAGKAVCLPSSSRLPDRRKVFFKIEFARNLVNNKDLEGIRLRELFEKETGIKADPAMDEYTRLTFGCRIEDGGPDISAWEPARRPKKAATKGGKTPKSPKAIKEPEPEERKFQFVPLNMGAYNRKYGKMAREGGRLEWNVYRYVPGEGKVLLTIGKGKRDAVLPRLYAAIAWNAIFLNTAKWRPLGAEFVPFALEDCLGTLKGTIRLQFEDGETFWSEAHVKARAQMSALWQECAGMEPDAAYAMLLERTGAPRREHYVPRGEAAALFERFRDTLAACKDYAEVKDVCGELAYGEVRTMNALLRLCRKDAGIVKGRPADSRTDFAEYLKGCPKDGAGRFLVSRTQYNKKAFRDFCRMHGHNVRICTSLRPLPI